MTLKRRTLLATVVAVLAAVFAVDMSAACPADDDAAENKIDPKEIIFEHLGDGYGWEVPFNHLCVCRCP